MNNKKNMVDFNIETEKNIPKWIQWCICITVLSVLTFYTFKIPELEPTKRMQKTADSIAHGDISAKNTAMWELQNADPIEAASLTNILIDALRDETLVTDDIAKKYHKRNEDLAGPFSGFYTWKTITIGDLAAFSIRRIRQRLIIETAGDGGPTSTVAAVRKAISERVVPLLCCENEVVRIRVLKDILWGDTDPSPINTLLSCCLNDASPAIRKYSLAVFITYVYSSKTKVMAAVPKIIDLLNDSDETVRYIAHRILTNMSQTDLGTNSESWKDWFSQNGNNMLTNQSS